MRLQAITLTAATILVLHASSARSENAHGSFNFSTARVGGAAGAVTLAGSGSYSAGAWILTGGGEFRCVTDITQGPLSGCKAGEGVKWRVGHLLPSTNFSCSANADAALGTAVTDRHTVVMTADFYRQGDSSAPSFTAKIFVSAVDLDPEQPGNQNLWIQGIGCGEAAINFK
jgi:hypothetical protein